MKNKLTAIILSMFLLLSVNVWAAEGDVRYDEETQQAIENIADMQNLDEESVEITEEEQVPETVASPYKQPISKKKILKKFILAMLGVLISSLALYFGLTVYNKIREIIVEPKIKDVEGETPLQSPADLEDAVRTFLDKTKW